MEEVSIIADLAFKIGTPMVLIVLLALNTRYATREDFSRIVEQVTKLNTTLAVMEAEANALKEHKRRLDSHSERIRSLEIEHGSPQRKKKKNIDDSSKD